MQHWGIGNLKDNKMTAAQELLEIINNPSVSIDKEWCDKMKIEYPYFNLPEILYYQRNKETLSDDERKEIVARIAVSVPSRTDLYSLIGDDAARFVSFYPAEENQSAPDTYSTIDKFLGTFGYTDEKEIEMLNKTIFNPTPDYAMMLASEEEKSKPADFNLDDDENEELSDNDVLINRFITKSKEKQGRFPTTVIDTPQSEVEHISIEPVNPVKEVDDSMLSESLAKIYIKQRKYSKALEIIRNISLKYPEKSIYFADQIRFLQKLIINEQFKNNN